MAPKFTPNLLYALVRGHGPRFLQRLTQKSDWHKISYLGTA